VLLSLFALTVSATHFRFTSLSWTRSGATVTFNIQQGFRTDYFSPLPTVGSTVVPGVITWGDNLSDNINLLVQQIDTADDWLLGSVTISHTYADMTRVYNVYHQNGNRLSTLADCNHDRAWQISSTVNFVDTSSPVLTGIPILYPTYGQLFDYTIPTMSSSPVTFSITPAGAGNPGDGTSGLDTAAPAGLTLSSGGRIQCTPDTSVNPGSCDQNYVSTTAPLFAFQVTAATSSSNSVALDFLFQVGSASPILSPTIAFSGVPASNVINVNVGSTVTFNVIGTQPMQSQYPTNHVMDIFSILPPGASLASCAEGLDGAGFSATNVCTRLFTWTPSATSASVNLIFTAENSFGLSSMPITLTINVIQPGACPVSATVSHYSCNSNSASVYSSGTSASLVSPCV